MEMPEDLKIMLRLTEAHKILFPQPEGTQILNAIEMMTIISFSRGYKAGFEKALEMIIQTNRRE